jgi:hypothetical protein
MCGVVENAMDILEGISRDALCFLQPVLSDWRLDELTLFVGPRQVSCCRS